MKKLILMALTIFIFGCAAAPPTSEQIATADYGSYPTNYENAIKSAFEKILKDPYSAHYSNWRGPSKAWRIPAMSRFTYFGYRICVDVNAKNSFGGYVGNRMYYFLLKNGQIIDFDGGYEFGTIGADQVNKLCQF